ncbi:MAG: cation diffusion facilitator family transporter [Eubacteriales bacterium]|nr:cation diffusion facilitator family transporter [Eubacteriales bacterium]MDD4717798.1 cation diffusion facilitator family transporter [Eubacteriales bacterium]
MEQEVVSYDQGKEPEGRQRSGKVAGLTGLAVNALLFAVKLFAGIVSGSIAVIADAVNNLTDAVTSAVTFIGFSLSSKPADREHPYGHARIEYIAGFLVAVLVVFLGFELSRSSVIKIISPEELRTSGLTIAILIFSVLVKAGLWIYYKITAVRISSLTLKAAAADSRNDVAATLAILISLLIKHTSGFNADGIIGLLISFMIIFFGIRLVIDAAGPLIGSAPPEETVHKLESGILKYDGIVGIHDLHIHTYGYKRFFASVHCEVSSDNDLLASHELADEIEREISESMGINLVIHIDPVHYDDERTKEAYELVSDILKDISKDLSMHDFRVVWGRVHTKFIFDVAVPYDFDTSLSELRKVIENDMAGIDPNIIAIITFDRK